VAVMREGSDHIHPPPSCLGPLICRPTSFVAVTLARSREATYRHVQVSTPPSTSPKPGVILQDWQKVFQLSSKTKLLMWQSLWRFNRPHDGDSKGIRSPHILRDVYCYSGSCNACRRMFPHLGSLRDNAGALGLGVGESVETGIR